MRPNYNDELGYPYGVHQGNRGELLPHVVEDIMDKGRNLSWEQYIEDAKQTFCASLRADCGEEGIESVVRDALGAVHLKAHPCTVADLVECFDDLTGPDCDEAWELVSDAVQCMYEEYEDVYLYEDEEEGVQLSSSCLGGCRLVFVEKSPWVCSASLCSPCVPGAGDLDTPNEGGVDVLCLPPSWFEGVEEECPYVNVRRIDNDGDD
jgi:hypothetical protein